MERKFNIIWVKEVADRVTVKKVRAFVNNDAIIEPFVDMEAVGPEDCIIVSKTDNAIPSSFFVNAVIVYEDVFEAVTKKYWKKWRIIMTITI